MLQRWSLDIFYPHSVVIDPSSLTLNSIHLTRHLGFTWPAKLLLLLQSWIPNKLHTTSPVSHPHEPQTFSSTLLPVSESGHSTPLIVHTFFGGTFAFPES